MTAKATTEASGHARYTYRLRLSSTARRQLEAEWDRARWVWNAKTTMARQAADAAIGATEKAPVELARKHGGAVHLVHPAHTTMDCARCGARTKHALPLSERTYACTACGAVSPRDKNSARVMLVRAGLHPG